MVQNSYNLRQYKVISFRLRFPDINLEARDRHGIELLLRPSTMSFLIGPIAGGLVAGGVCIGTCRCKFDFDS